MALFEGRGRADEDDDEEADEARPAGVGRGRAGDGRTAFPIPPMDLVVPPSPRLRAR